MPNQSDFDKLSTEQFRLRMRPAAERIYRRWFPNARLEDLREHGVKAHVLDKEFGIDALLHLSENQWVSIQEKYRSHYHLVHYGDFTQEYKNAAGTPYESNGEWFQLGAQLYFYGWANESETDFERWILLDIARYKLTVERQGGLAKVGTLKHNKRHGRASFYAIPLERLDKAILLRSKAKA